MSTKKWAYKPGEVSDNQVLKDAFDLSEDLLPAFVSLVEKYSDGADAKRTMVLNDNRNVVYFVQLDDDFSRTEKVDVFVWIEDHYEQLPKARGHKVAQVYFHYLDIMSDTYEYLGE